MIQLPRPQLAVRVWRRNVFVFSKTWRGTALPLCLDPILYLLAIGLGLGAYVSSVDGVPYREFLAPALCASAVMWAALFEMTYGLWARMTSLRVHETIVATPIEPEDVVLGELLWSGTRGCIYGSAFLAVITALGYVHSAWALLLPAVLFLGGVTFGVYAMAFAVAIERFDYLTYFFTLMVNPMFLFGGIFFPSHSLPQWAQAVAWVTPTPHLVMLARGLTQGGAPVADLLLNGVWLAVAAMLVGLVPVVLLRRRLLA